jgi:hypothetical protein
VRTNKQKMFALKIITNQTVLVFALSSLYAFLTFGSYLRWIKHSFSLGDGIFSYSSYMGSGLNGQINPHIAYPFGQDFRYFPSSSYIQVAFSHLVSWVTSNPFLGFNILYLLTFPICGVLVLKIIEAFGARSLLNVPIAAGFSVIPFHLYRLEHHELATLYSLPLGVLLSALITRGYFENILFLGREAFSKKNLYVISKTSIAIVILALSGLYYTFFTLIIMTLAVLFRYSYSLTFRVWLKNLFPIGLATFVVGLAMLPGITTSNATSGTLFKRSPIETLIYSGQLIDAVVPSSQSLLPTANYIANKLKVVNDWANSTGQAGVRWVADQGSILTFVGTLFLILFVFVRKENLKTRVSLKNGKIPVKDEYDVLFSNLKFIYITIFFVMLFLVPYGFNSLFANLISPQIRAWDRIVPLLQLMIIVGFAITLRILMRNSNIRTRIISVISIPLIIFATLFDSVLPAQSYIANQFELALKKEKTSLAVVRLVEEVAGKDCAVLQLPYIVFPESASRNNLGVYDPLWMPLVSKRNIWSYGGIYGSKQDSWLKKVSEDPYASLPKLQKLNFCALLISEAGYTREEINDLKFSLRGGFGTPTKYSGQDDFLIYKIPSNRKL